jgi:predicted DNA-binding transcriptional regulator AlpA
MKDAPAPVALQSPFPVDPSQILTIAELAERLKVSERWVYEKSRRRCLNPLPCIRIGRYLRFDWTTVSAWAPSAGAWNMKAGRARIAGRPSFTKSSKPCLV